MNTETKKINVGEVISNSWDTYKKNAGFYIGLTLVYGVVALVLNFLPGMFKGGTYWLLFVATFIVSIFLDLGLVHTFLEATRGKSLRISNLFEKISGKVLVPTLVATLLVILITFAGTLLLIVPGVIAAIAFMFTFYFIVDGNIEKSGWSAMKESARITKGNRGRLFLLGLLFILINLLGLIPVGLGLLVTIPMTKIAIASIYNTLTGQTGAIKEADEVVTTEEKEEVKADTKEEESAK